MPTRRLRLPFLAALAALPLLTPTAQAFDANDDTGAWFALFGTGPIDPTNSKTPWRWWLDAHLRFFDRYDGYGQSIARPGVGYDIQKDLTLWAGYAWIDTDPGDLPSFGEQRIWEQLTFGTAVAGNDLFSRTRLEQRFLDAGGETGWRLRQFLRLTRPLQQDGPLAVRVWDEVFFDLNDTDWGAEAGFSQNRFFAGLGWTFEGAKYLTLELGYLNQYIHREDAEDDMNHLLATSLILSL